MTFKDCTRSQRDGQFKTAVKGRAIKAAATIARAVTDPDSVWTWAERITDHTVRQPGLAANGDGHRIPTKAQKLGKLLLAAGP